MDVASKARRIETSFAEACRLDVVAFKPGNVSLLSSGHGMNAEDFLISARVAVPSLAHPTSPVGERVENAIVATREAVKCNTNLGIALLLAPLGKAAFDKGSADLRVRLSRVLGRLNVDDAVHCYRAIRLAEPAGMGTVDHQDISGKPTLGLREVMRLASQRDLIAMQYVNNYDDIYRIGLPNLERFRKRWRSLVWACTACYLSFLAAFEDSHIVRKHGTGVAGTVRRRASEVEKALEACENPWQIRHLLNTFDRELKVNSVNPGTSADLTVASVSVLLLNERLREL